MTNIFPSNQTNETCNREIVLTWRDHNRSVWRHQQTKKETEAQRRCQQHAKVCIWWTTTVSFGSSLTELFQTIYGHYFYFILLNLESYLLSPFPCSSLGHSCMYVSLHVWTGFLSLLELNCCIKEWRIWIMQRNYQGADLIFFNTSMFGQLGYSAPLV